jgi:hypothetical protein
MFTPWQSLLVAAQELNENDATATIANPSKNFFILSFYRLIQQSY